MKSVYKYVVAAMILAATTLNFAAYAAEKSAQSKRSLNREVRQQVKKFKKFIHLIHNNHLDTLEYERLTEMAINGVLDGCDPHSQYLPKMSSDMLRNEIESAPIDHSYMVDSATLCLKIARFSRNTSQMILFKYSEMGAPSTLILDLRGNKGGLVEEAINSTALFLDKEKTILTRQGRTTPTQTFSTKNRGELADVKLLIVIDHNTASASEILAAALKENNRATVIGEVSFGKGLILKQHYFRDQTSIVIATAEYLTPNLTRIQRDYTGRSTNKSTGGVHPTIFYQCKQTIDLEDINNIAKYTPKK